MSKADDLTNGARRMADMQISDAIERGAFDDLPGAGKPLRDINQPYDPWWWVKKTIAREQVRLSPQQAQALHEMSRRDTC